MRPALGVMAAVFAVVANADALLSEAAFAERYVAALKAHHPAATVESEALLALTVTLDDDRTTAVYLDNAYRLYRSDPTALDDVIATYVASGLESFDARDDALTAANIMPVVKDSQWLADINATARARGAEAPVEFYSEPLAKGLRVFYVIDTPNSIRYVDRNTIEASGIAYKDLRSAATANLRRLAADLQGAKADGLAFLRLDGNYDSSLLLLDEYWNTANFDLSGDIVVAIPARDFVVITATDEADGMARLPEIVDRYYAESPYRLTRNYYRRAGNRWMLWQQR